MTGREVPPFDIFIKCFFKDAQRLYTYAIFSSSLDGDWQVEIEIRDVTDKSATCIRQLQELKRDFMINGTMIVTIQGTVGTIDGNVWMSELHLSRNIYGSLHGRGCSLALESLDYEPHFQGLFMTPNLVTIHRDYGCITLRRIENFKEEPFRIL